MFCNNFWTDPFSQNIHSFFFRKSIIDLTQFYQCQFELIRSTFSMKHVFLFATFAIYLFPISMAITVTEANSFDIIMQLINPKRRLKQIRINEEKLPQSSSPTPLLRTQTLARGSKGIKNRFLGYY